MKLATRLLLHNFGLFLSTLIVSALLVNSASAKSGIVVNKDEVIIRMAEGYPALKAKINNETYYFLISTSIDQVWISPEIAAKFRLDENASKGRGLVSHDTFMYKSYTNKLNITFSGLKEKEYTVEWFGRPHYEGFDGAIGIENFGGRKVTFIFDEGLPLKMMKKRSYRQNIGSKMVWRKWLRKFVDRKDVLITFKPHYDVSRMTIGAGFAFQNDDNLTFSGEPYFMPSDFAGYKQYVAGEFKSPISPLKGLAPLRRADVQIKEGSLDEVVETGEDEVITTAKSKREYLPHLGLGRDYFEGCHSVVFSQDAGTMTTYCPEE